MLTFHTQEVIDLMEQEAAAYLEELGRQAVSAVRSQMLTGYARPILKTGALLESISSQVENLTLTVGSPLSYASAVHKTRPFLADGLGSLLTAL